MWFTLSILGFAILAVVSLMDKYLLSNAKVRPMLFTFYSTAFLAPVVLAIPFVTPIVLSRANILAVLLGGVFFVVGMATMFLAVEKSEVSHVGPLMGATLPIFSIIAGRIFLHEILSTRQIIACTVLIVGSLLISFEKSKRHNGIHLGMLFGVISGLFFSLSDVASKYVYSTSGFVSGLVYTRVAIAFFGLFLFFIPGVYKSFFGRKKSTTKDNLFLVIINKVLGVVGVLIIQYAIAVGSVSLVNSLTGLRYALLIILVMLFSRFWPKKFKEDYARWEYFQEIFAVIIIAVGLILLI